MSVIQVQNLNKSYVTYPSELHRFLSWFGLNRRKKNSHTVIEDISFNINPGEAVALVGQNGAGKSTLLKMIVGTIVPSSGQVHLHGKVAAILELGMGFNPEFTGLQNAQYLLSVAGYSAKQIKTVMPEIYDFSEIGDYFNQPVRTYSSGMQVRVAFAVATAFRPDILIIDEALSVGDSYFQHKSFARIRRFKEQGTTLLFVSHDKGAILELCDRALLIQSGKVLQDDTPSNVMDYYNALIARKENSQLLQTEVGGSQNKATRSGSGELQIAQVTLFDQKNQPIKQVSVGQNVTLQVAVKANKALKNCVVGMLIKDRLGQSVFGTNTHHLAAQQSFEAGESKHMAFVFDANLGVGSYSVTIALHVGADHLAHNIDWQDFALVFEVVNTDKTEFVGTAWLSCTVKVQEGGTSLD